MPQAAAEEGDELAEIESLRRRARLIAQLDKDRISDEDLRDLNQNFRSSMMTGRRPQTGGRVSLYPVVLEARKLLIHTGCLYEHTEHRRVFHRALADAAEVLMQRLTVQGDYMHERSASEKGGTRGPDKMVLGSMQVFQTELEGRLEQIRGELDQ